MRRILDLKDMSPILLQLLLSPLGVALGVIQHVGRKLGTTRIVVVLAWVQSFTMQPSQSGIRQMTVFGCSFPEPTVRLSRIRSQKMISGGGQRFDTLLRTQVHLAPTLHGNHLRVSCRRMIHPWQ